MIDASVAPAARAVGLLNRWRDHAAFGLFFLGVVLAPIPFGSVRLFWIVIWTAVFGLALLLADGSGLRAGAARLLLALGGVMIAYGVVALLQSISPGPQPDAIWALASKALGETLPPLSGAIQDAPLLFLGRPLLFGAVFACGLMFSGNEKRARMTVLAIISVTAISAIVGGIALAFGIRSLRPYDQGGSLTTVFINRNTSGTYIGSGLLLCLSLLLTRYMTALREGRSMRNAFLALNRLESWVLTGALLLFFILLPLTLSRGGVTFTILIAAGAVLALMAPRMPSRLPLVIGALGLFALVFVLSGQQWRARQALAGFESEERLVAYEIMLRSIFERPLLGVGLGTFAEVFPFFRTDDLGILGIWNIGHSTPLELAFEGGVPLALLVGVFVIACGVLLVRGIIRRPHDPYILAAMLMGLLGLIHSSIDFSLQMPGYAVIYMAVAGLGVGRAMLPSGETRVRVRQRRSPRPRAAEEASPRASDEPAEAGIPAGPETAPKTEAEPMTRHGGRQEASQRQMDVPPARAAAPSGPEAELSSGAAIEPTLPPPIASFLRKGES